jgi:hypothetical protein
MGLDMKMMKKLGNGELLTPYIEIYQNKGEFPDKWVIEIDNFKRGTDQAFHPSGDCLASEMELYKRLTEGETKRTSASLRRVFDCGHFWHGYYQNILIEMGYAKPENIERSYRYEHEDGWEGRGTLDCIVDFPTKGEYIVDMKTMNDIEYDTGPFPQTLAKWTAQVNCYMHWTGIRNAFILAIRKGGTPGKSGSPTHDLREITIEYDEALIEQIYAKWSRVWKCVQEGTPPEAVT